MFDVAAMVDPCLKAAAVDQSSASEDELLAIVRGSEVARAAIDAVEAHALAELEVRDVCDREFGLPTAAWVAHETHGDQRVAKTRTVVATKLAGLFDEVDRALSAGSITYEHARALADAANPRVAPLLAAEQGVWIERAQREPFKAWLTALKARVELLDQDGPFDPTRDLFRNTLTITRTGPDSVMFRGELFGEYAIGFTQLLEAHADEQYRQALNDAEQADLPVPRRSTLLALALYELLRLGHAGDRSKARAPVTDLTLVIHDTEPDTFTSLDGEFRVAFERLAHLACLPAITTAAVAIDGVVLALGRTQRYASIYQRRALILRDGCCTFPGCHTPASWCDAHHVHHWEHGGLTDIADLVLLCRHHHGVIHRRGWTMTANPDQTFTIKTPRGDTLTTQRHQGRPPPGG